jgi:protein-S-isoprenylcysteine O-methyltransferase Ste14
MQKIVQKIQKLEFEARIFISFAIVILMCYLSFHVYRGAPSNLVFLGNLLKLSPVQSKKWGYLIVALWIGVATVLRMWAGSVLTSHRMMAFQVQKDCLIQSGPYRLVRNPIYLADLIAYIGFALCLKPVGCLLPVLIYLHFSQLVRYEERSLKQRIGEPFLQYSKTTPRFIPNGKSIRRFISKETQFLINYDGFRNNSVYMFFVPGFVVASVTDSLLAAVLVGLPAVFDWAIVHTRKGLKPSASKKEKILG